MVIRHLIGSLLMVFGLLFLEDRSVALATALLFDDDLFYFALRGGVSASKLTCALVICQSVSVWSLLRLKHCGCGDLVEDYGA